MTDLGHVLLKGQNVTQGSMGREAPRFPPWGPSIKQSRFHIQYIVKWHLKGLAFTYCICYFVYSSYELKIHPASHFVYLA